MIQFDEHIFQMGWNHHLISVDASEMLVVDLYIHPEILIFYSLALGFWAGGLWTSWIVS